MARLLMWRLARTALAVWALASGVFLLSRHDLATALQLAQPDAMAPRAGFSAATPATRQATEQALRQRLGLNRPIFYLSRRGGAPGNGSQWHWNGLDNQYHRWVQELLRGRLGTSFRTGEAVSSRLRHALLFTLPLTGSAAGLAILLALALAQRLAARPWWQRPIHTALVTLHALPLFVVALGLLMVFANPEALAWFPAYGLDSLDGPAEANADAWSRVAIYLWHMALPVAALTLTALPELSLQLEASLAHELRSPYATTARAKGLAEAAVIRHHALRNALLPSLAMIAEIIPALVAGAVVVEVVFALPGMGRLLVEAAAARDFPVLVGGVLLIGTVRLLALLVADLLYFWADPRIRWQS